LIPSHSFTRSSLKAKRIGARTSINVGANPASLTNYVGDIMSVLTCDHCGEYTCDSSEDKESCLMWCSSCIKEDQAMIDALGFIHNRGDDKKHFCWYTLRARTEIGALPKKWKMQPPIDFLNVKIEDKPFAPVIPNPCSRKYYGLPECTCGMCPPKRHQINTNPFRYGQ
jgi:hypothetical protein